MKQCPICLRTHNHFSCPYCGTLQFNGKNFDIANMMPVARAIPAPREFRLVVGKKVIQRTFARLIRSY